MAKNVAGPATIDSKSQTDRDQRSAQPTKIKDVYDRTAKIANEDLAHVAPNRDPNGTDEFLVLREESNESSHGGSGKSTPRMGKLVILEHSNKRTTEANLDKKEHRSAVKKGVGSADKNSNNKS